MEFQLLQNQTVSVLVLQTRQPSQQFVTVGHIIRGLPMGIYSNYLLS